MGQQGFVEVMVGEENQSLPPREKGSDQHGPVNETTSTLFPDMEPVRLADCPTGRHGKPSLLESYTRRLTALRCMTHQI